MQIIEDIASEQNLTLERSFYVDQNWVFLQVLLFCKDCMYHRHDWSLVPAGRIVVSVIGNEMD